MPSSPPGEPAGRVARPATRPSSASPCPTADRPRCSSARPRPSCRSTTRSSRPGTSPAAPTRSSARPAPTAGASTAGCCGSASRRPMAPACAGGSRPRRASRSSKPRAGTPRLRWPRLAPEDPVSRARGTPVSRPSADPSGPVPRVPRNPPGRRPFAGCGRSSPWTLPACERTPPASSAASGPVGILPPDQYLSLVVRVTEGCSWNACTFCSLYRNVPFRAKSPGELRAHLAALDSLLRPLDGAAPVRLPRRRQRPLPRPRPPAPTPRGRGHEAPARAPLLLPRRVDRPAQEPSAVARVRRPRPAPRLRGPRNRRPGPARVAREARLARERRRPRRARCTRPASPPA